MTISSAVLAISTPSQPCGPRTSLPTAGKKTEGSVGSADPTSGVNSSFRRDLTHAEVGVIRSLRWRGLCHCTISKRFQVEEAFVRSICRGVDTCRAVAKKRLQSKRLQSKRRKVTLDPDGWASDFAQP